VSKLEIQLQRDSYAPGDRVHGWVRVVEGGASRGVEVSLRYQEKTDEFTGSVIGVPPVTVHQGELGEGESYEFTLQLPSDALPAYSNALGQMWWELIARSAQAGRDVVASRAIEVSVQTGASRGS
jgi:hypothetical protein